MALADTRIVSGAEISVKSKLTTFSQRGHPAFVMTSGLRSVRDKAVHRLSDDLAESPCRRMHQLATAFGQHLRRIRSEDGESLDQAGLTFNSHALIGGRLVDDEHPSLFHVYPEGNWVEVTPDHPVMVIGRSSYSKPLLDRLLRRDSTLRQATTLAYLAFDSTRTSATDVDFPIDVAVLHRAGSDFSIDRFSDEHLFETRVEWNRHLCSALGDLPDTWMDGLTSPHHPEPRSSS